MIKAILDTDILSEISKGIDPLVLQNASDYLDEYAQLTFTSISVYEILYGLQAKNAIRQTETFLELIEDHEEIVPTRDDYRMAAAIRAAMQQAGTPIGNADPIIAACATRRSIRLVTGNTRHYSYIQNAGFALQLLNWRDKD